MDFEKEFARLTCMEDTILEILTSTYVPAVDSIRAVDPSAYATPSNPLETQDIEPANMEEADSSRPPAKASWKAERNAESPLSGTTTPEASPVARAAPDTSETGSLKQDTGSSRPSELQNTERSADAADVESTERCPPGRKGIGRTPGGKNTLTPHQEAAKPEKPLLNRPQIHERWKKTPPNSKQDPPTNL